MHRPNLEVLEDRCLLSFSPITILPVGPNPQAVVTADFNNDGNLDLATMNYDDNTVSAMLGDGLGGFGAANHFATGTRPQAMAVADFNNDGNLDVATANGNTYFGCTFSVLMGEGDGTFRSPVDTTISEPPQSVAVGDFNADGNMDLVYTADVLFDDGDAVYMRLGDGLGGFADRGMVSRWNNVDYCPALAVADLTGHGDLDVVTVNGDNVSVLLGTPDGGLTYIGDFATGEAPRSVAVGDFTGDGIPDLVTAGQTVDILPGLGNGSFAAPISHSASGSTVVTADFNGDGKLDVTVGGDFVTVLLGRGDGTLAPPIDHAAGSSAVAVADFNGDGRPDVAAYAGSNTVAVLLNDGAWSPDDPPAMSISNVTVTEGNSGTVNATFALTLSRASDVDVTVHYDTADITAAAGSDYTAESGDVIIPAGQTSQTFTIAVIGDRLASPTESFAVNLSAPTNAMIGDGQGIGTILDNEPRISISDMTKAEGKNRKTTLFTFTVTLSTAYDQPVTMSFRTADGTAATGDNDYVAKTGTLTFNPGETTKSITIEVMGDSKRETNETFFLDLFDNSSNSLITKSRGLGTIWNDD